MSVLVIWLNDIAVSWGRTGAKRVILESVEQIAYGMLRTHKAYATKRFSISVRAVEGQRLIKPTVTLHLNDNGPAMHVVAEEAELHSNPATETLRIVLRDCEIEAGIFRGANPEEFAHDIPLSAATRRGYEANRPSDISLGRIAGEMAADQRRIEELKREFAAEAALEMLAGDIEALTSTEWAKRHQRIRDLESRLHRLHTEPWRRVANGFSCFCFALVGAPLAIRLRNADGWSSFGLCFLPILIVYYPLMIHGVDLAKSGRMPPVCVWLGNLVLAAVGYWQSRWVVRY
jgi:lipopolysaccharide export system permease protein